MNKLSWFHFIAIGLITSAAIIASKSNNRYSIRDAILEASRAFLDAHDTEFESEGDPWDGRDLS